MRAGCKQVLLAGLLLAVSAGSAQTSGVAAAACFRPGKVWLDESGRPINAHGGGVLFHDGVYYWYGEHKEGRTWTPDGNKAWGGTRCDVVGVHAYSSRDLYRWRDEGIVLAAVKDDPNHDLHTSKVLERPKVAYNARTGKFVMWLHVDSTDYAAARAGVAVADSPTGPFVYQGSVRPEGQMSRDQTLFVDDDGKAYRIYSSENNATTYISLLTDDYLRHSGTFVRAFVGRSMEAQSICKRGGKYYLVASGCTGWAPNAARCAVADAVTGPWRELGNPCRGPGAATTFGGQSTYLLPVAGKPGAVIFMADIWNQHDLEKSAYLWLPMIFDGDAPSIVWQETWDLGVFDAGVASSVR